MKLWNFLVKYISFLNPNLIKLVIKKTIFFRQNFCSVFKSFIICFINTINTTIDKILFPVSFNYMIQSELRSHLNWYKRQRF